MKKLMYQGSKRKPVEVEVRELTKEDFLKAWPQSETSLIFVEDKNGFLRNVRWNGKARVWKTRPDEYERSVKYGLYEHCVLGKNRPCTVTGYTLAKE